MGFDIVTQTQIRTTELAWRVAGEDNSRWLAWEMAAQHWLNQLRERSGSENTVRAYIIALQVFFAWASEMLGLLGPGEWCAPPGQLWDWRGLSPDQVTPALVEAYIHALTNGTYRTTEYAGPVLANLRSGRFHHPGCRHIPTEAHAKAYASQEAALADGYTRCELCAPDLGEAVPVKKSTVNARLAAPASLYEYAQRKFVMYNEGGDEVALWPVDRVNPFTRADRFSTPADRSQYPSDAEVAAIFGAINTDTVRGKFDYALLYTIFYTCLRADGALGLKWGDIARDGSKYIVTYRYKGGDTRQAVLSTDVYNIIVEYLKAAGRWVPRDGDYLFRAQDGDKAMRLGRAASGNAPISNNQANRILKKYARRAGVTEEKAHLHGLRHAGARLRYHKAKSAGDLDLQEFQALLGHKHIATTQLYIQERIEEPPDPSGDAVVEQMRAMRAEKAKRRRQPKPEATLFEVEV